MTPTARSLKYLRERGYRAEVVEKFNSFTKQRKDLWGFGDIVCLRDNETLLVQTTSGSNVSSRIRKITDECADALADVRKAGWRVEVHGWRKNASNRWVVRVEDIS